MGYGGKERGGSWSGRNDRRGLEMTRPRVVTETLWEVSDVRHGLKIPRVVP